MIIQNNQERIKRQEKLANLFFEMGMDLDLVEKMSGIDKRKFLKKRIDQSKSTSGPLPLEKYDSNFY